MSNQVVRRKDARGTKNPTLQEHRKRDHHPRTGRDWEDTTRPQNLQLNLKTFIGLPFPSWRQHHQFERILRKVRQTCGMSHKKGWYGKIIVRTI